MVKKARISIEITSRPKVPPKPRSLVINAQADAAPQRSASPPIQAKPTAVQIEPPPPPPPKPTNHHQKVVNGIKHELDRLQPNSADLKAEKRKLRSQEGTRFKSELSAYFPEYDEVIGNEPKEDRELSSMLYIAFSLWLIFKDILNLDTPIIIIDSAKTANKQPAVPRNSNGQKHVYPLKEFPDSLFDNLHNAQRVDFSFLDKHYKEEGGEDPLSDEYFVGIHRKPERQEKAIRNSDKGRAQHERDQVIRLLEGLQGHDWLKLMGVSGITESKKKDYEPAREHFIKGCEAILEKFRLWREEEKRRKLEKEAAAAEAAEEEEEDEEEVAQEDEVDEEDQEGNISDGDPPDYSDVDASAARQLHEEAIARSAPLTKQFEKKAKVEPFPAPVPEFEKEFTSFFAKPYLRAAALGKHRRSGRSVAAWGHPVPEVADIDFDLPEEYRDEETLKAHARRKRRDRRVSKG